MMNRPASASDRGWRNSAVHREVDNRHARWVIRLVLGAAIALAPSAVYLLRTMSYVETSYAIEALRVREARLIDAERRWTIEKAVMESLPAVEERAGAELGLEHPNAARVVVVSQQELGRLAPSETPPHRPPSR
jgi:hypothetical protein